MNRRVKIELLRAQEEVKRIQAVPLVIGQFLEMVDENAGIVSSTTGSNYYVRILSTLNRELLKPSLQRSRCTVTPTRWWTSCPRGGLEHLAPLRCRATGREV